MTTTMELRRGRWTRIALAALLAAVTPAGAQHAPVESGEATPGAEAAPVRYDVDFLPPAFHRDRRSAVAGGLPEGGAAVFLSAPTRRRQSDVSYEYRQDSDLLYLTGAQEPGSALLLVPGGIEVDGETVTEMLFVPSRDPSREAWTGRRFGPERAERRLGVEAAVPTSRFEEIVGEALEGRRLYHLPLPAGVEEGTTLAGQVAMLEERAAVLDAATQGDAYALRAIVGAEAGSLEETRRRVQAMRERGWLGEQVGGLVADFLEAPDPLAWRAETLGAYADGWTLRATLDSLRTVKEDAELYLLQRAIDITAAAHREAMRSIEPGMHEYEVEGLVEYVFRRGGAEHPGFPSIIGSGENSTVLHYETSRRRMEAGDVVVMDIGAEYHGYTADVTRTVPVSGRFSPEQRAIYDLVLRAQRAGIEAARAGEPFQAPHRAASAVLAAGLAELGLISGPQELRRFFMHGTSHYLGLDVHDVGTYGILEPGTVLTVEPGLYISPADDVDPRWWDIGVRIEDDVLVTAEGPRVLSAAAPREAGAIEALMGEAGLGNHPVQGLPAPPAAGR